MDVPALVSAIMRWIDPVALLLVVGGSFAVAMLRTPMSTIRRAFAALGAMLRADPEADAHAATMAVGRLEALVQVKDIVCADRLETAGKFLRRAVRAIADAPSADIFARWAEEQTAARARRHAAVQDFWAGVADAGPAMGMIGTVVGLGRMFAQMDDPAALGPAMAGALLATLYGLLLANLVAGPIAARLEALSVAELGWQRRMLGRFEMIARAEIARPPVAPSHRSPRAA
ncbi:MotA/TolQ/ExbB proton channel family protein [Sphingomonas naphthae]|uniref:MotA/TolQ/ExbB proton channel family protein n=1 Tax=Sphingomonas naphthae TaxID=1813468 RepID=A0ABY7TK75_9SPHN|nr:MotA/TolQ/ExbB proton channel family protein [Sphingomonas naphthae]WCT73638.1 MotA/TolQ/ExbB proton channel family protein [Sphingomonas naphthae]